MGEKRINQICKLGFVVLALFSCTGSTPSDQKKPVSDTIITNARVYTLNPHQPWGESLAIRNGRILAVGSVKQIEAFRGPATKLIDAGGHLILPGLTDCHVHFMAGSMALHRLSLDGATTITEIQNRVREFAAAHPDERWIRGRGWDYHVFGSTGLPDKKYLDEIVRDRPVFLMAFDNHTSWVNSKALSLAGITRETLNPFNGVIVRDAKTGDATGALKEGASKLVTRMLPEPTRTARLEALLQAIRETNRFGIVRVHSAGGDFNYLDLYDELRNRGQLTVRLYVAYLVDPPELTSNDLENIEKAQRVYHDDWISVGAVKFVLDGVIESHTAAMLAPYADESETSGKLFWSPEKYYDAVRELDHRGFQVFTHAVGDYAVRSALDAYEKAAQINRTVDARHRVEHIETITAQDIPRFGRLGIVASMQPRHAYPDENTLQVWVRNVGQERAKRAFPWRSIASAGGRLGFGSDWPIVTLNPWVGMQTALLRQDDKGNPPDGWLPQERLGLHQVIESYTLGAAFAGHREKMEGSLVPGNLADLIVVSQDVFDVDPKDIAKTQVLLTLVGGKVVYESPEYSATSSDR